MFYYLKLIFVDYFPSDAWPRSVPALELHSRAESSVGVMYRSSGPNTGSNPGGGRILKKKGNNSKKGGNITRNISTRHEEFINLNFQANLNQRIEHHNFIRSQNFNVGQNILLNRLCSLNNTIPQSWTNESYLSHKLKCKNLFLKYE